ncbi:MAG: type II toxin-antitoxin system RelE/ParE family toxin [Steroidobacteraceae bacterium]|nr:type II toxin-antitoxin system RelE/ParE family toxin [Steroidobacteraceae bacterium]MCW5573004.1 type II toxin-antitoxin system RelE/ParE family toxin [Steroidobacteraceae bacterium]
MTYSLSVEAEAELAEAIDFYALNVSRKVAENFLAMFEEKAELLVEFPGLGAPTSKGRRLCPIGRYPYSILYRERDGFIYISAVAHQSRRPKYWQARKP